MVSEETKSQGSYYKDNKMEIDWEQMIIAAIALVLGGIIGAALRCVTKR